MLTYLLVALGGAIGSVARFWCAAVLTRKLDHDFPAGTLFVNVSGSFVIGMISTLTGPEGKWPVSSPARTFLMIGILGGYTTFSSFSLQTLDLARSGRWGYASLNVLLSVALCLIGVLLGHLVASQFNAPKEG